MSDIVERLRNRADAEHKLGLYVQTRLLDEAADEIERLRKNCKAMADLLAGLQVQTGDLDDVEEHS